MTVDDVRNMITELFDTEERNCVDSDCIHCSNWFYPCGYLLLYQMLLRWGFEEVWNSNQGNSAISFAPTHVFERDGILVEVWYSGWDIREEELK